MWTFGTDVTLVRICDLQELYLLTLDPADRAGLELYLFLENFSSRKNSLYLRFLKIQQH